MQTAYFVFWDDTAYIDVLPKKLFEKDVGPPGRRVRHSMIGTSPGEVAAVGATLIVNGNGASLTYGDDESTWVDRGELLVEFAPGTRVPEGSVSWRGADGSSAIGQLRPDVDWHPVGRPLAAEGKPRPIEVIPRRGQGRFRAQVLAAYGHQCALTGCSEEAALEAAHISPYAQEGNQSPTNGIALRRDLHALFDANLIGFDEEGRVLISTALSCSQYVQELQTLSLSAPVLPDCGPDSDAMRLRRDEFRGKLRVRIA